MPAQSDHLLGRAYRADKRYQALPYYAKGLIDIAMELRKGVLILGLCRYCADLNRWNWEDKEGSIEWKIAREIQIEWALQTTIRAIMEG